MNLVNKMVAHNVWMDEEDIILAKYQIYYKDGVLLGFENLHEAKFYWNQQGIDQLYAVGF